MDSPRFDGDVLLRLEFLQKFLFWMNRFLTSLEPDGDEQGNQSFWLKRPHCQSDCRGICRCFSETDRTTAILFNSPGDFQLTCSLLLDRMGGYKCAALRLFRALTQGHFAALATQIQEAFGISELLTSIRHTIDFDFVEEEEEEVEEAAAAAEEEEAREGAKVVEEAVGSSNNEGDRVQQRPFRRVSKIVSITHTRCDATNWGNITWSLDTRTIMPECEKLLEVTAGVQSVEFEDVRPETRRRVAEKLRLFCTADVLASFRESVAISGASLTEFPPRIADPNLLLCVSPTNLTSLDLSMNSITEIPASIAHATALTSLDLMHNCLTTLPEELFSLTRLVNLKLSRNQLHPSVSPSIAQLVNLNKLYLAHNLIEYLPSLEGLAALDTLTLNGNRLAELPATLALNTTLTTLALHHNPFYGEQADETVLKGEQQIRQFLAPHV